MNSIDTPATQLELDFAILKAYLATLQPEQRQQLCKHLEHFAPLRTMTANRLHKFIRELL